MAKTKKRSASGRFSIARSSAAPVVVVQKAPRRRRAAAAVRRVAGMARRGASRAVSHAKQRDLEISASLGALALGISEQIDDDGKQRVTLPTFNGIDPALLYGGAALIAPSVAPSLFRGKLMKNIQFGALGIWCAGVARSVARKSIKVSGEDDE